MPTLMGKHLSGCYLCFEHLKTYNEREFCKYLHVPVCVCLYICVLVHRSLCCVCVRVTVCYSQLPRSDN